MTESGGTFEFLDHTRYFHKRGLRVTPTNEAQMTANRVRSSFLTIRADGKPFFFIRNPALGLWTV